MAQSACARQGYNGPCDNGGGDGTHASLGGHDKFEFDGRVAVDRPVGRLERAVYGVSVRSHRFAPRVRQCTTRTVEQPDPSVRVRHAFVQTLGDCDRVNVQTYVRSRRVRHRLRERFRRILRWSG